MIGLSLGLLGGGGSILTVPVLVFVLGYGVKQSIAMSLAVVGTTSLVGALGHWRAGRVRLGAAAVFTPAAMVGTFGGAVLARFVSSAFQLGLFAVVMVTVALFMLIGRREEAAAAGKRHPVTLGLSGAGVGVLTGLVGIGGGFLIVPALVLMARLPMKEAVGTSLLIIVFNAATGFLGYLGHVDVDWVAMGLFTLLAILGVAIGTYLVHHVPAARLRKGFAVFLIVVGALIMYRNLALPFPDERAPAAAPSR